MESVPIPQAAARCHRLRRCVRLAVGIDEAFHFFCDPSNLGAITPPDLRFRITEVPPGPIGPGAEIRYAMRLRGIPFRWHTRIRDWEPGRGFVDEALSSPYASWTHRHTLRAVLAGETEMLDEVDYVLPFWPLGELFRGRVGRELDRIFDYREQAILTRFGGHACEGEGAPDAVAPMASAQGEWQSMQASGSAVARK